MIQLDNRPTYYPAAVIPMREQLREIGFSELLTPDEVDQALTSSENATGTTLLVINSVCGCAAGNARPGAALALQHERIPDRLVTVFAGMEKPAVARAREHLLPNPPSSPAMALFKDGKLVSMFHRRDIETRNADQVAELLVGAFDEHCTAQGPSIPREKYLTLEMAKFCGSTLPRFQG